jgi:hypothetical protein
MYTQIKVFTNNISLYQSHPSLLDAIMQLCEEVGDVIPATGLLITGVSPYLMPTLVHQATRFN